MIPGIYRTRSGHKARVLCNDAPGSWPCVGYVIFPCSNSSAVSWEIDGRFSPNSQDAMDIIGPWEEVA